MAILNILTAQVGLSGITPKIIYIDTTDTVAGVTATGYLNKAKQQGFDIGDSDMALVVTRLTPSATATQVGWYEVQVSGSDYNLASPAAPGSVTLPTIANHIATYTNTTGALSEDPTTAISGGNIQAGLSGTAGTLASFPGTGAKGSLVLAAVANTGDTTVTVSNAAHGQATVISIPDGGQATTEFIIADSAGTQNVTSGNIQVDAGNIVAGSDANAGYFESHPATTASGTLRLTAADSSADALVTISNADHGQSTVYVIPDVGGANGSLLNSALSIADVNANVIMFDVTVTAAALAAAGTVTLISSSGSKQYMLRELFLNTGTDFTGGGGDRLATISDGTTDYTVIPAASLQSLANDRWGGSNIPYPASAAISTATAAGANLTIAYSGGASDYASGSVVISGIAERIA